MQKNVVAGLGEIGEPIRKLFSKKLTTVGYDINPSLMDVKKFQKFENMDTLFLHVCIPFSKSFSKQTKNLVKIFNPKIIVIHSTISPNTTSTLQTQLKIPVIYSATRGVHKRMLTDLKRYTKFFAINSDAPKKQFAVKEFKKLTGYGIVINTSFNVQGEPIVCKPEDALRTFYSSGIDALSIGGYLIKK